MATIWENKDVCACKLVMDFSGPFHRALNVMRACSAHAGFEPQELYNIVAAECRAKNYGIADLEKAYTDEMKALITDKDGQLEPLGFAYSENVTVVVPGAIVEDTIPEARERELKIILPEALKPFLDDLAKAVPHLNLE